MNKYSNEALPEFKYIPGVNKKPSDHMKNCSFLYAKDELNSDNWNSHQTYLYGFSLREQ